MTNRYTLYALFFAAAGFTSACAAMDAPGNTGGGGPTFVTGGAGGGANGGGAEGKHGPTTQGGAGGTTDTSSTTTTTPADAGAGGGTGGTTGSGGVGGAAFQCGDEGTAQVIYMSSDDSSSMGSPGIAREYLAAGMAPPPELIRTWEFLNYYRIRYPVPVAESLDIHAHFAPAPDGNYRLQIGIQAFQPQRPPMALTFVLDTSGSLVGEGIAREREAVRAIAGQLAAGDRVNFVTWANDGDVILQDHVISGPNDPELLAATNDLAPGGGSDLHAGLTRGYELAELTANENRLSRVILMSDGGANIGVTDASTIADQAKHGDDQGIYLVGIGLGPAVSYSDKLMNTVTDAGRGAYVYLHDEGEAQAMLGDRFDEVMDIAARSVTVKVTLPSYFAFKEFNGEGMSTNASEVPPQHLAPGDSMIFDQILTLAAGKTLCGEDPIGVEATWQNPLLHPSPSAGTSVTWQKKIKEIEGETWQLLKAEAIVSYARVLQSRSKTDYDRAVAAIDAALDNPTVTEDPDWTELQDIEGLLQKFPVTELQEK